MWDFDPDEWFFLAVAIAAGVVLGIRYYLPLFNIWKAPIHLRMALAVWPVICLAPIFVVLCTSADPQVRGHPDYVVLFMAGGALWIFATAALLPIIGVRLRDDAMERANAAAAITGMSAMLANALCYAGANIGTGPTIWTTIVPAIMAVGALGAAALVVRLTSPIADAVAIDRDVRSALIFGGFLLLASVVLAFAAAGDFVDWNATVADFARRAAWGIILIPMAIAALWMARPRAILGANA